MRHLIAIGASTGGTVALESILSRLPLDIAPVLIVQHTLPGFTGALVRRLDMVCPMRVVEAVHGQTIQSGVAYIAPGDSHLFVERQDPQGRELRTMLTRTPPVHFHRPSIDVLFHSLVTLPGVEVIAVLLTGMGQDGVEGMVALRGAGAHTIAQDEASSVIFGMPKKAIERGAAQHISSLDQLPDRILSCLGQERRSGSPVRFEAV